MVAQVIWPGCDPLEVWPWHLPEVSGAAARTNFNKLVVCLSCRGWDGEAENRQTGVEFAFCLTHGLISSNSPVSSRPWLVRWVRARALFKSQIPAFWKKLAAEPLQSLGDWIIHFQRDKRTVRRCGCASCVHQGDEGGGKVMWLSGLHLPESYLPAQVQVRM